MPLYLRARERMAALIKPAYKKRPYAKLLGVARDRWAPGLNGRNYC